MTDHTVIRFPKTPRIAKVQSIYEELPNHHTVIEEKIDGANVGIRFEEGNLVLQSRGHVLRGGHSERQFTPLYAWAYDRIDALKKALGHRFVLYGEWCFAKHRAFYDALPDFFIALDVLDTQTDHFLSTPAKDRQIGPVQAAQPARLYQGPLKRAPAFNSLIGPTTLKTKRWKVNLLSQARKVGHKSPLEETDDSGQMEGVYTRIEDQDHVVARVKTHRTSFEKTPSKGWKKTPLISNMLRGQP